MNENEMGNRGSKSKLNNFVKEQRADGNWWIKPIHLRCALMGCENSYRIKFPSKQLILIKKFSTLNSPFKLNEWFITGFTDSEGSFTVMLDKNINRTLGWRIQAKFQIGLHVRDLDLLLQIQEFFGIGSIGKS
jgi:hypothetical protein